MTREEILRRLDILAETKPGMPLPEFLRTPNGWGPPISELAQAAAFEIRLLQGTKPAVWPKEDK